MCVMWSTRGVVAGRYLLLAGAILWTTIAPLAVWSQVANPNGVAVIIGNRAYEHERVPEVAYARRDAAAFKRYVLEVLGFDPLNVIELNDASQSDLHSAFGGERSHEGQLWSFLDPEGGSDLVVFYSGHGVPGLRDGRGYLLPIDADPDTADINGYPIDLLYENLGKLHEARTITVYLDACFSGDSHAGMLVRSASPVYIVAELPEEVAQTMTVLTAASGTELASWDEEARHGLFTDNLLDALYGKADADGDGRVTSGEVASYLKQHMTRAARRLFKRHQNASLHGSPDAVLSKVAGSVFPERPVLADESSTERSGGAADSEAANATDAEAEAPRVAVQRDLYVLRMIRAHEANDHDTVLKFVEELQDLGVDLPAVAGYLQGVAYQQIRWYTEAKEALTRYAANEGQDGDYYRDALESLLSIDEVLAAEQGVYERAHATGTAAAYGNYLESYPTGRHAAEARRLQEERQRLEAAAAVDDEAYARAQRLGTAAAYADYLSEYSTGRHAAEARRLQEERQRLEAAAAVDDEAYARAQRLGTAAAYADYLSEYSTGRHAAEARRLQEERQRLEAAAAADDEAYARAQRLGTAAAYADYLREYPTGRHAAEARRLQEERQRLEAAAAAAAADDEAYARAQRLGTAAAYADYLSEYSTGRHAAEARRLQEETQRLEAAAAAAADDEAYARAQRLETAAAYADYLREYPTGRHAAEARRLQTAALSREEDRVFPGLRFQDCDECPSMVVVPAGSYMMGSPASEERRGRDEDPQHIVRIAKPFAVGVYEVTRGEYGQFVVAAGHQAGNACWVWDGEWSRYGGKNWSNPGFQQTDRDPVLCVSWKDATAYVRWLSRETGEEYRLLSEAEWEYVARAGTDTARYWGATEDQCRYGNGADRTLNKKDREQQWTIAHCDDGYYRTSPVGSYEANSYGLYDVLGNVWEWTQDCLSESYAGVPTDGSAWERGECDNRVFRGGSWSNRPSYLRSANRGWALTGHRNYTVGFRVARAIDS